MPPHASVSGADELEQLEELGDDAIIAQQQGAHAPQPRVLVNEDARSVVIAETLPPRTRSPAAGETKRRERTEKTVVIRERRQIDELRREMARRKPKPPPESKGMLLWVVVGVAAFVTGGIIALLATREDEAAAPVVPAALSLQPEAPAAPAETSEPPSVSIDELPIEGSKSK